MAAWKVIISDKAQKDFLSLKKSGELSKEDQDIIRSWAKEIIDNGLENVIDSKKWNDHALHSDWEGYRSSSFSFKGRLIYKIVDQKALVEVVKITTTHNYAKGESDG